LISRIFVRRAEEGPDDKKYPTRKGEMKMNNLTSNSKALLILTVLLLSTTSFAVISTGVKANPGVIQDMINSASPGATVVVPAGLYLENIIINTRIILQGAGSGSDPATNTIIQSATSSKPVITLLRGGDSPTDRMIIKDLQVTGAGPYSAGNSGSGITVRPGTGSPLRADYITFDNVAAVANGANGIAFDVYNSNDIVLNHCNLSNNGGSGLRFPSSGTVSHVTINDSTFDSNGISDYSAGIISYSNLDGLTVNDGKFTNNNYWGIFFDLERGTPQYVKNVEVNGAIFDNNGRGFQIGIYTQFTPDPLHEISNIKIHDSSFTRSWDQGVRFYADGAGYETVVIDARNNWWGDLTGPYHPTSWYYGTQLITNPGGKGDAVSDQVLYDPWKMPLKTIKQNVLDELTALRGTVTDKKDGQKLDEAIKHLTNSLDPDLWLDEAHLNPKHGDKVFNEEKDAVVKLVELLNDKKSTVDKLTLQGFIDRLVGADKALAKVAIDDALTAHGDLKKINKANGELGKGDAGVADSHFTDAIEHYRNAWKHAIEAV